MSKLGFYESQNLNFLKNIVKDSDSVIDIGAHYGIYTKQLATLVGQSGQVTALEPLPEVFLVLKNATSDLSQVTALNCAASDGSFDQLELNVPLLAGGLPEPALACQSKDRQIYKSYIVKAIKLNELKIKGKLTFIKIDAEGHEDSVLRGAAELISLHKPVIQVEISESNFDNACQPNPFNLGGYSLNALENERFKALSKLEKEGNYYLVPCQQA